MNNQLKMLNQMASSPPSGNGNAAYVFFLPSNKPEWIQATRECGYYTILLQSEPKENAAADEDLCTARRCTTILAELLFTSTEIKNHVFVAASYKSDNEALVDFFKANGLRFLEAWRIFKNLPKDTTDDTRQIIKDRIKAFVEMSEMDHEEAKRNTNLDAFHILDESGRPRAPFDYKIAEHIKKNYDLFVVDGLPYLYESGAYKADNNGTAIKRIIKGYLLPQFIKSRAINAIYTLLVEDADLQRNSEQVNQYPDTWICFKDCMLDAADMKAYAHSPEYFCVNQIPHKWRDILDSTKGETFRKFFSFAVPDSEDQKMFLEYAGLCFTKDSRQQKILLLTGMGGTGKSLLLGLIGDATGNENCAAVSLQGLQQRFSTSLLFGKTVNICADLPSEALTDSSTIKQLAGDDVIFAERKGEQAFTFKNYAKQVYSCNALPLMQGERNNGIFRRLLILEMNNTPDAPDPGLYGQLRSDLLAFMRLAVAGLHQMYTERTICESDSSKKAVRRLMKDSDTVSAWVDECCELDKKARVERTVLYDSYSDYCSSEERQSLSKTKFFATLRSRGLQETKSSGIRGFAGIKITGQISVENCPESALGVPQNCPEKGFLSVDDGQVAVPFDKTGQK